MTALPSLPPDRTLFARGRPRSFTGRHLREIAFPLGGIGTGSVSLGGRGDLRDWEIFNRPAKGLDLPQTFVALRAQVRGAKPVTRVAAARPLPPFGGSRGLPRESVPGLPHLRAARFTGTFPTARVQFEDESFPLRVSLEAFSPFVPLQSENSGLPVAILTYHLSNPGSRSVSAALVLSALNPVGYAPPGPIGDRRRPFFGGNVNRLARGRGFSAIHMTSRRVTPDDVAHGSLAIATTHTDVTWRLDWGGSGWFDDLQQFWDELSAGGRLAEQTRMGPTPDGETEHGSLGALVTLRPGEMTAVTFLIAWHFPWRVNDWSTEPEVQGATLRNAYADRYDDALAVVRHTVKSLGPLTAETRRFRDALFGSTLPRCAIDAAAANLATLRTNTVLWLSDGRMHGFEGCDDEAGCCPMDCTHVWNYSQAEAHLFPTLARSMRETEFGESLDAETGHMAFRSLLPLGRARWAWQAACDGQLGTLVRLFREWNLSGDLDFLRRLWPAAKSAHAYAMATWDTDGDGLPDGVQHVTYDIELVGPNPLTGVMALAAHRAMAAMAQALGEPETAAKCEKLFEKARKRLEQLCWNGSHFHQSAAVEETHRYQIGAGCLSDQLLGEWLARTVGLGPLLPPSQIRRAARAIFRHNWRADLTGHANCQRSYALEGEAGLLLCTWPRGERPDFPFPYSDEVWTGIEYAAAALMIDVGLVREGLAVVHGARSRHDGARRNPFNEPECGHHYARAMSSWSLITALSGFRWSAQGQTMAFEPRIELKSFRAIWSNGQAWGTCQLRLGTRSTAIEIEVLGGSFTLRRLELGAPLRREPVHARVGDRSVEGARAERREGRCRVMFAEPLRMRGGETLSLRL